MEAYNYSSWGLWANVLLFLTIYEPTLMFQKVTP